MTIARTAAVISLVAAVSAAGLAACEKQIVAPDDLGICWAVVQNKDGTLKYNKLASNVPNMETCAATLEGMRLRFNRLGQQNEHMVGAYQANFVFLEPEGVLVGRTWTSARYVALVRTGDGRLAIPGAIAKAAAANLPPLDAAEPAPPPAK